MYQGHSINSHLRSHHLEILNSVTREALLLAVSFYDLLIAKIVSYGLVALKAMKILFSLRFL
jgi:hypothetical protein